MTWFTFQAIKCCLFDNCGDNVTWEARNVFKVMTAECPVSCKFIHPIEKEVRGDKDAALLGNPLSLLCCFLQDNSVPEWLVELKVPDHERNIRDINSEVAKHVNFHGGPSKPVIKCRDIRYFKDGEDLPADSTESGSNPANADSKEVSEERTLSEVKPDKADGIGDVPTFNPEVTKTERDMIAGIVSSLEERSVTPPSGVLRDILS